ncbi:MAG: class IV adenylate cyclase [Pirellulaceae bacterium]
MTDTADAFEIEQKFHVADPKSLESRLSQLGAREQPTEQHADVYFNHPCRDFAQTHEALRVRYCNGIPMVTYKGTKLPGAVKARRELEWRLDPGDADGTQMQLLLTLLGFQKVITVKKLRRVFSLTQEQADFTITIDDVQSLGWFAEVELLVQIPPEADLSARDERIRAARERILGLAPKLGLHQDESRSYLRMLLSPPNATSSI